MGSTGIQDNLLIVVAVGLNATAQLFLRGGMLAVKSAQAPDAGPITTIMQALLQLPIWGELACYGVSVLLWFLVLARVEVGKAYPMQGIGYVFVAIAGCWLFGEALSLARLAGITLIVVGAYVVLTR
ncbi:MAG: EamA family transporter [Deltaproteobacteria bacterium]|nr:EamA family transporter [Deltaproteobacteria bacterium]